MGAAERQGTIGFNHRAAFALAWGLLALAVLLITGTARGAVSCASPDNLCVGDPCVTGQLEVTSPCVIDFGDRTLVIRGTLKVPNNGVLSLRARDIDVRRAIVGRHARRHESGGSDITLMASRNITVRWRIDASARTRPGKIHLMAGNHIKLLAPLRAATSGPVPTASGGSITVEAGGTIDAVKRARLRVRGSDTPGGEILLNGSAGVRLQNRITASGSSGGNVRIVSARGDIVLSEGLDTTGDDGDGGSATLIATVGDVTLFDRIDAEGSTQGGKITLIGGGPVTAFGALRAGSSSLTGNGGDVVVAGDGEVLISEVVNVDGMSGGQIVIGSTNESTRIAAPIVASGGRGNGGRVVLGSGKNTFVGNQVDADGGALGGMIEVSAGQTLTLTPQGALLARGDTGGEINLDGGSVTVPAGGRVLVDGDVPGGSISFAATAGDLILDGDFRARGRTGGRIEGMATGDVVAGGAFAARGDGCISLSGNSLDVSGGTFDVPLADACQ